MNAYRENANVAVESVEPLRRPGRAGRIIGALVMIMVGLGFSWAMFSIVVIPIMIFSFAMAYVILTRNSPEEDARRRATAEARADAWMRGYDVIR
ncbi:MAG TPA: hypothetical protein VH054_19000 [Polyangiaceae bacterium]|jgi:hypothetical protein|nr:hypothetical protein [Polyangiaceae bacterium]